MTALKPLADIPVTGAGKFPAARTHHDVDFAELFARLLQRRLDGRIVADVEHGGFRGAAGVADRRGGRLEPLLFAAHEHDFRSVPGESFGHPPPDPASAASNKRNLTLQ